MHPHRLDKIRLAYLGIVGASNLFDWPPGAIPKLLFNIWKHTHTAVGRPTSLCKVAAAAQLGCGFLRGGVAAGRGYKRTGHPPTPLTEASLQPQRYPPTPRDRPRTGSTCIENNTVDNLDFNY